MFLADVAAVLARSCHCGTQKSRVPTVQRNPLGSQCKIPQNLFHSTENDHLADPKCLRSFSGKAGMPERIQELLALTWPDSTTMEVNFPIQSLSEESAARAGSSLSDLATGFFWPS